MSAALNPFGLRPIFHQTGLVRAHAIYAGIPTGYATNLYRWSPVVINTSGQVVIAANAADMSGSFAGVEYTDSNGRRQFANRWTASTAATEIIAYIYDEPNIVYEIQAEGAIAQTAIGDQVNFSSTSGRLVGDGDNTVQVSRAAVSTTLAGAGSQGMLRVIDKAFYADNDWGDAFTILQVQVARHVFVSNKVGI